MPLRRIAWTLLAVTIALAARSSVFSQNPDPPSWTQPVAPFRIVGNIFYVGTADLGSYLITTPEGHFLLDTTVAAAVPQIERNVATLGFKLADIKYLLNSQAHFDHAAGLAPLKTKTGAQMVASGKDAEILERGGRADPVLGDTSPFPPVRVDRTIRDGDTLTLAGVTMTARITPGHTAGATTWMTTAVDGGRQYAVVFPSSTSVLPSARLADPQSYPGMADDYTRTFALLKTLTPDVFLAAHAGMFDLAGKMARMPREPGRNPFVDPSGYKTFIADMEKQFLDRLKKDRAAGRPVGANR
jgi:metallo-beta-lactamase class B